MNIKNNPRAGLLIAGMIMFFVFGSHLLEFALQSDDIWWTPASMMESIDENRDRVEIFVQDISIQEALADSALLLKTDTGTVELKSDDIGLRMNNRDRVRSWKIPYVATESALFTAAIFMIVIGVIPIFAKRREDKDIKESVD